MNLVAGLFLCIKRRANTDGVSANTGSTDLGNVSTTVNLLAAAITWRTTERFHRQLQAAYLHSQPAALIA